MKILAGITMLCAMLLSSCDEPQSSIPEASYTQKEYDTAVANGVAGMEVVREFEFLYPDAEHFITYYAKEFGRSRWNSHVGLHGRYKLTLQFEIEYDESRQNPKPTSEPTFYLNEVESIEVLPDGRHSIKYTGHSQRFGVKEWKTLLEHKGEFESIGDALKKNQKVPGFDEVWEAAQYDSDNKSWRANRSEALLSLFIRPPFARWAHIKRWAENR